MSLFRSFASAAAALALVIGTAATAAHAETDLDQTIDSDQPIVTGEAVLSVGHIDMGPRFVDGEWSMLIHDDAARDDPSASSAWRYADETVLHVTDAALRTVPDDAQYGFVGADPGADIWIVPQTQDPDVVWLGWNTQDPAVMASVSRGVTLSLLEVQGPGTMTVYLQSGTFGEPDVLWDSRVPEAQRIWVDVNTHTHANWTFTEPGVYLVQMRAEADLIDGSSVGSTEVLRILVGDETPTADAFTAEWSGSIEPEVSDAAPAEGEDSEPAWLVTLLLVAIALVAGALIVAVVVLTVRGRRIRRSALDGATADDTSVAASER